MYYSKVEVEKVPGIQSKRQGTSISGKSGCRGGRQSSKRKLA